MLKHTGYGLYVGLTETLFVSLEAGFIENFSAKNLVKYIDKTLHKIQILIVGVSKMVY